jgi:predicted AlkP superfamily pyrophosphatase or phosphodiesterase
LISLDGFAASYLRRNLSQSLEAFAECGTQAEFIYPSFPSKTFPNHYTIVTGLYPESHGIIDNSFQDLLVDEKIAYQRTTKNPKWYNGEPASETSIGR